MENRIIQITDKILGVIVPVGVTDFKINKDEITEPHYISYNKIGKTYRDGFDLYSLSIFSDYKIHGTCTLPDYDFDFEVNESWVESIVFENNLFLGGKHNLFKDYTITNKSNEFCLLDAKDSFRTRIQKAIQDEGLLLMNPYEKPEIGRDMVYSVFDTSIKSILYHEDLHKRMDLFNESESKVIRGKLLIIEKI